MDDLKPIIAGNMIELRKSMHLTQAELAEKLNYSDKAVSKWERAESIPDVAVLKQIADLFGVTVDYLLTLDHSAHQAEGRVQTAQERKNKLLITLLATSLVWLIATMVFVYMGIYFNDIHNLWIIFVYAVPLTMVIFLIFNSIWGKKSRNFLIITVLVWSVLLSVYLTLYSYNLWLIFIIGIPAQFIIFFWSGIRIKPSKKGFCKKDKESVREGNGSPAP